MKKIDAIYIIDQCQALAAGAGYATEHGDDTPEVAALSRAALNVIAFSLGVVRDYLNEKYEGKLI